MTATDTHEQRDHRHDHPTDQQYVAVAMVLAAITAGEVGVYYIKSLPNPLMIGLLCAMAFTKFTRQRDLPPSVRHRPGLGRGRVPHPPHQPARHGLAVASTRVSVTVA